MNMKVLGGSVVKFSQIFRTLNYDLEMDFENLVGGLVGPPLFDVPT